VELHPLPTYHKPTILLNNPHRKTIRTVLLASLSIQLDVFVA